MLIANISVQRADDRAEKHQTYVPLPNFDIHIHVHWLSIPTYCYCCIRGRLFERLKTEDRLRSMRVSGSRTPFKGLTKL